MCLDYLDHIATSAGGQVFVAALEDSVPRVRCHPIRALTCEACKDEPLCTDAVAPPRRVIINDANAKMRFEALRALVWRDPDAPAAAIDEVVARVDRELLAEATHPGGGRFPALRNRTIQALAA